MGVISFLPCGSQESSLGPQAWWQSHLPPETSHLPYCHYITETILCSISLFAIENLYKIFLLPDMKNHDKNRLFSLHENSESMFLLFLFHTQCSDYFMLKVMSFWCILYS